MKIKKSNEAVSNIIGMMLLLMMVISTFSLVYIQVLSDEGPQLKTFVKIGGKVEGTNVVLEHKGGESIGLNSDFSIEIAGVEYNGFVGDWLKDVNDNGVWNLGERMQFPFEYDLYRLGEYDEADIQVVDKDANSIVFMGPIDLRPVSDVGLEVTVDNLYPEKGDHINIIITVTCYGGDVNGSGNVQVKYLLSEGLAFVNYIVDQGTYDTSTGIWNIGNLLVENSPVNLTITAEVIGVSYHQPTQLGIIFEGSAYTAGSVNVWQNTYLSALMFALDPVKYGIIPADGSVELTVVSCGWTDPPRAEIVQSPIIITEDNAHDLSQDLRNTPYPGGYSPISSAIRMTTDQLYNSDLYSDDKRQIILVVTSGNPDCIWDDSTSDGYGAVYSNNIPLVHQDTINAAEYLNSTIDFNLNDDELNAITVAKTVKLRNSIFMNESIVIPKPGNIYDINNPIVEPGWVFEVEPGKEEFQEALNLILKLLFNSIAIEVEIIDSTTIDLNTGNDNDFVSVLPIFV
jgi:hypothetical protein